jgi:uncharacterized protein (DUF433 family)
MSKEYVEKRGEGYYVAGTRVSLDSMVYAFLRGEPAEAIQQSFPALKLEEVYGAITYYLANQKEIDRYLAAEEVEYARQVAEARQRDPELYERLEEIRKSKLVSRP